jgi:hypothetical protein
MHSEIEENEITVVLFFPAWTARLECEVMSLKLVPSAQNPELNTQNLKLRLT